VELSALLADPDTLCLGAAVEALSCAAEDDRVDKAARTAKGPLPGDAKAVAVYLEAAAHAVYRADYAAR
jgi:hypothetical protein